MMNLRFWFVLSAAVICFAAPYVFFQIRINEAFMASGEAWNVVRFVKFFSYALVAPGIIIGVSALLKNKLKRGIWIALSSGCYGIVLLTLTNYYDYFGIVPHWRQLFTNLDEVGSVGSQIGKQLIGTADFLTVISILTGAVLTFFFPKKSPRRIVPFLLILPGIFLLGIQLIRHPIDRTLNTFGYTMGCSHYGILPTYAAMLTDFIPREPRQVPFPFPEKQPHNRTEKFGTAREANVICIQIESLDASLIDREIGGEPVMPFLTQLSESCVFFSNCVAMHSGGGSSDAELASLLSLVPIETGSGFTRADWSRITPLSRALKNYASVGFHANRGSFFERSQRYAAMGFDAFHDQKSFTGPAAGWYSKDREFFDQTLDKLAKTPEPFFAYLITMQSHGPFQNFEQDHFKALAANGEDFTQLSTLEQNYLATFREVDEAIGLFFKTLSKSSFHDNTVVFIFGDHESGVSKTKSDVELAPLFIWKNGIESIHNEKRVSHLDIAPTITDLLGHEADENWLGTSVFSKERRLPVVKPSDGANPIVDFSRALLGE